jgi:hypothetical protein
MAFDLLYIKAGLLGVCLLGWVITVLVDHTRVRYRFFSILGLSIYLVFGLVLANSGSINSPPGLLKVVQVELFWPLIFFLILYYLELPDKLIDFWLVSALVIIVCHITLMYAILFFFGIESYIDFAKISSFGAKSGIASKDSFAPGFTIPGLMSLPLLIPYYFFSRRFMPVKAPLEFSFAVMVIFVAVMSFRNFVIFTAFASILIYYGWGVLVGKSKQLIFSCAAGLAAVVLTLTVMPESFWDLLQDNLARSNNEVRRLQAESLLNSFEQNPLFGAGLGQPLSDIKRSVVAPWSYELTYHAILSQRGAIGFLGTLTIFGGVLLLHLFKIKPHQRDFYSGYFFALLFLFLANATNPYFGRFDGVFLILLGLLAQRSDKTDLHLQR